MAISRSRKTSSIRSLSATGRSESDIVRQGLHLMAEAAGRRRSALRLAGRSVGRFKKGPRDLSTNRKHLEGFGE